MEEMETSMGLVWCFPENRISQHKGGNIPAKKYETVWVYIFMFSVAEECMGMLGRLVWQTEQETPTYFREDD